MMLALAYSVEHEAWGDQQSLCERAVKAALEDSDAELPEAPIEVSLVLSDDARVQDLNREWRGKDSATNVLSFPAYDDEQPDLPEGAPLLLGDIILAYETCVAEADRDQISVSDHLTHLVVHGVLHLLGYDHLTDEETDEMEALEISILAKLGIENPYKDDADV